MGHPLLLIPWFKLEAFGAPFLGPIKIQPFGILATIAILVGAHMAQRRATQLGLEPEIVSEFLTVTTLVGLISSYVLNIVLYSPALLLEILHQPRLLLERWAGLSSYGGFVGGLSAGLYFCHRRGLATMALADAWCFAIPFAWFFARMGCFVVHDHPGIASDFLLAVDNYDGGGVPRHDLGLYEVLWSALVAPVFVLLARAPRPAGYYMLRIPLLYGPIRFFLDFLRAGPEDGGDVRYFGLTPAQYLSLALIALGLVLWARQRSRAVVPSGRASM
jgi:phosphatidylglycerol:prolipoprotein diacylglycerol transferase